MIADLANLFYKQKGLCYWCKRSMDLGGTGPKAATREHLIPQSRGGKNVMKVGSGPKRKRVNNVVAACHECNNKRGNMDAHTFKSTMRPHVK